MRSHLSTRSAVLLWGSQGGQCFAADRRRLVGLDRHLRERWSMPCGGDLAHVMSPPWASGLLVHTGPGHVWAFDEQGGSQRAGYYSYPKGADPSLDDGVAMGRGASGGWIVAE